MTDFWSELLSDVSPDSADISDVPVYEPQRDIFATHKRKQWDRSGMQRCDFARHVAISKRNSYYVISIWRRSAHGRTLREIKADDNMVEFFAAQTTELISEVVGSALHGAGWALITTPKRRHLVKNFASRIAEAIAERLDIPFYDIVTTGMTLEATKRLLDDSNKNLMFFVGINNHL